MSNAPELTDAYFEARKGLFSFLEAIPGDLLDQRHHVWNGVRSRPQWGWDGEREEFVNSTQMGTTVIEKDGLVFIYTTDYSEQNAWMVFRIDKIDHEPPPPPPHRFQGNRR